MIALSFQQPEVLTGLGGLPDWLAAHQGSRVEVIVDGAVLDGVGESVLRILRRRRETTVHVTVPPDPGNGRALGLAWLDAALAGPAPDAIVAVGGGRIMDAAKLLAACLSEPSVRPRLESGERCGWTPLPRSSAARIPLVAVPTTLGTGSEMSRFACFDEPAGRRLVQSDLLRPDLAVLEPTATSQLGPARVLESILEIFARTAGPYVGTTAWKATQDRVSETICARLVEIGTQVEISGEVSDEVRQDLAHLSGLTHSQWLNHGRDAFSDASWFLAADLATAAGSSKASALATLLPHAWRTDTPEEPLVAADRVVGLWSAVTAANGGLPRSPADGLRALLDRWELPRRLVADIGSAELTRRTVRRWSGGLPMLARVSGGTIAGLYDACLERAAEAGTRAQTLTATR